MKSTEMFNIIRINDGFFKIVMFNWQFATKYIPNMF